MCLNARILIRRRNYVVYRHDRDGLSIASYDYRIFIRRIFVSECSHIRTSYIPMQSINTMRKAAQSSYCARERLVHTELPMKHDSARGLNAAIRLLVSYL